MPASWARHSGNSSSERGGARVFRANVLLREEACRVTRVNEPRHLKASHIKPWRDATDAERLDGANGLLLSPHIDHLFDEGYITFSSSQELVIVPKSATSCSMHGASTPVCASASSRGNRTPIWTTTARTCSSTRSFMTRAPYLLKDALAVDEFVNADTIAQGLSAYRPDAAAVTAGKVMLERLRALAKHATGLRF